MIKLGVIGYEGHGEAFTEALNGSDLGEKLGMKVTQVWQDAEISTSFSNMLNAQKRLGFESVETLEQLEDQDGVLVVEERPTRYLALAKPFLEKKIPTFVNRPVGPNAGDAAVLFHLARSYQTPLMTGSSLVFDPEVRRLREEVRRCAPVQLVYATGPGTHVGFYLPHVISVVVTILGPGLSQAQCLNVDWEEPEWTSKNGLVAYLEYGVGATHPGARIVVALVEVQQWYGFRLKMFGAGESPEYDTYQSHGWEEILTAFREVIRTGRARIPEAEALEVPKVYYAILASAREKRVVSLEEVQEEINQRLARLSLP